MATRESRAERGRRRGRRLLVRTIEELRLARVAAGVGQQQLADQAGWSQSAVDRLERDLRVDVGIVRIAQLAAVLGFDLSVGLHPTGDPVRDRGQIALANRFEQMLAPAWRVTSETLLPTPGDRRAWDKLLRLTTLPRRYLVGVDLESRVSDIQELTRRTRLRERDGGVDAILLVLSDSATNRRLREPLVQSLGTDYRSTSRAILAALRAGGRLPGSGVILL